MANTDLELRGGEWGCFAFPEAFYSFRGGGRPRPLPWIRHSLYHGIENSANQNTGKQLYIRRYYTQLSHPAQYVFRIDCVDDCIFFNTIVYRKGSCVYTEKIQVTPRIFHAIPLENRCITSISSRIDIFRYKYIKLQKDKTTA